jgi:mono/diheme cytochrome c family protein
MTFCKSLLVLIVALLAPASGAYASENELASIARGGRLYEDWVKELGVGALRTYERAGERRKERPGRCVDCHGWDYSGKDGPARAPGLMKGMGALRGAETGKIKAILGDDRHGYTEFMKDEDLEDLANFVAKGQIEMQGLIDPATLRARGDSKKGAVVFQTICANCHGNDGQQIVDTAPLGDTARANPWRALHTLLNGHPNGNMPSLRTVGAPLVVDILASAQELPSRNLLASIVRGGRLYDTWYKENKAEPPTAVHPAYPIPVARDTEPRTTWRCKECHGWDYQGWKGTSEGKEFSIGGVDKLKGADPDKAIAALRNDLHAYKGLLSERDVADLANFLTKGQANMDLFIDRTTRKARSGSAEYESHFQTICAPCHGADGREIRTMPPLGRIASQNPWRALHGIINGHPGEAMPALVAFPPEMSVGLLAYIQTLPPQR